MKLKGFAAIVYWVGVSLAACGACGCMPAVVTTVPALSGRVVNSQGRPVSGATIEVSEKPGSQGRARVGSRTFTADAEGRIERPEERKWMLHMIPGDVYGPTLQVKATANGVESVPREVSVAPGVRLFGLGSPQRVDVGELRLP